MRRYKVTASFEVYADSPEQAAEAAKGVCGGVNEALCDWDLEERASGFEVVGVETEPLPLSDDERVDLAWEDECERERRVNVDAFWGALLANQRPSVFGRLTLLRGDEFVIERGLWSATTPPSP